MVAPLALEAVRRFDAIFEVERSLNGLSPDLRREGRRRDVAPLVKDLERWMRAERCRMSRHSDVAKAMDYMLTRWPAFVVFLEDGRICLSNNAAERALRGIALGRKAWLFRWLGTRRRTRGAHLHVDPDRKAQQRRSPCLARRRSGSHRRSACSPPRRPVAVELAAASRRPGRGRGLILRVANPVQGGCLRSAQMYGRANLDLLRARLIGELHAE